MSNQKLYEECSMTDGGSMFESFDPSAAATTTSSTLYSRRESGYARSLASGTGNAVARGMVLSSGHAIHQLESLLMQDTRSPSQCSGDDFANPLGFMNLGSTYDGGSAEVTGPLHFLMSKSVDCYAASQTQPSASTVANSPMMSASNEAPPYAAASRPIPMMSVTGYHMQRASSTSPLVSQSLVPGTPAMTYHMPISQSYPAQSTEFGSPTLGTASSKRRKEPDVPANYSPYMHSNGSPSPLLSTPGSPSDLATAAINYSYLSKRERNRLAAERCRKKKHELIGALSGENQALKQENLELAKVNQVLEQKLDYLINVMASYGIPMPYKK